MVGWHHPLNGHELEQAPGVGDGQGGLGCHAPWGRSESDTTHHLRVLYNQAILPGGHEHKKLLTTVECVEVCVCVCVFVPYGCKGDYKLGLGLPWWSSG